MLTKSDSLESCDVLCLSLIIILFFIIPLNFVNMMILPIQFYLERVILPAITIIFLIILLFVVIIYIYRRKIL